MKDRKIEFNCFTIPEWQKEQNYLQQKHKNGWKFIKLNFIGIYHFEKCEPEDVIYQLDYNPESIKHKDEYIQLFNDCGWEYIQDYVGYSYFRKPASQMNGNEEIFCDDFSRFDMMKRVFNGRIIPLIIIFFLIILPNLYIQSHINSAMSRILTFAFIGLFILYVILFLWFGNQFWQYWKRLNK